MPNSLLPKEQKWKERKERIWTLLSFMILAVLPILGSEFQEVKTKVTVYSDLFLTESGFPPLPDNAVELDLEFSFQSSHFQVPGRLASDSSGHIYVTDSAESAIFKFDTAGKFLLQIGSEGRKKGCFLSPAHILADETLVVHDTGKKSLEYMDFQGNYLTSFKISGFSDIVSDGKDLLFVASNVVDKKSPLVKVYSSQGKGLFSFGEPLLFHHSMQVLNSRSFALNEKGELFVAFTYFPLVRKYSPDGMLLAVFELESTIMKAKEKFNLQRIGAGIANPIRRAGYMKVISGIKIFNQKIFLMSHYPRLEILEIDEEGGGSATFWKEHQEVYDANDFLIQQSDEGMRFYVLKSYPKCDVDVFRIKEEKSPEG